MKVVLRFHRGPEGELGEPDIRENWNAADDLHVTIGDYAKFIVSVSNDNNVSQEVVDQRMTFSGNLFENGCPWGPDTCPLSAGFGLGWAIFEYENETVVMQGGGDWGERSLGFFVPERGVGAVIFTNGANGSKVIKEVVEAIYPNTDFIAFLSFQAGQ